MQPRSEILVDDTRPALVGDGRRPVRVHVWRVDGPGEAAGAVGTEVPLVVLSHGTGGATDDLAWWASGLHRAGFDVVAIDHHGNTHVEPYVAEAFVRWWDRARDVSFVLDHVPARGPVGVCGFSIGGCTAAALSGARIAPERFQALLGGHIEAPPVPEYPGLREELLSRYGPAEVADWARLASADLRDERVAAAFLLCPALGPLVDEASLAAVGVPVAVRWTQADQSAPPESNGMRYAGLIPGADGGPVGTAGSGHYGLVAVEVEADLPARSDVVRDSVAFFDRALRGT